MADVDWSGAYAGAQVMDHVASTNNVNGNISGTATWTHTVGVGQNPLRMKGNYIFIWGNGGSFTLTASSSNRFRIQPNGAESTWKANVAWDAYIYATAGTTATISVSYIDSYYTGVLALSNGVTSITNIAVYYGTYTQRAFSLGVGAAVAATFDSLYVYGATTTVAVSWWGNQALTATNLKFVNCNVAMNFASLTGACTLTNVLIHNCYTVTATNPITASTITRVVISGTTFAHWVTTLAAPNTYTMDEWYVSAVPSANAYVWNNGTAVPVFSNGVVYVDQPSHGICLRKVAASNTDILCVGTHANGAQYAGTNNNCFISVNRAMTGQLGADYDDAAQWTYCPDTNVGMVTSTDVPMGFQVLDANRTNALAVPVYSPTWSAVSDAVAGGNVTIQGTSGIKSKSRVLLRSSSGGASVLESPWQYDGFLDPRKRADFTLPVTAHSHVISESILAAGATYFYVIEGIDPVGRRFLSSEGSFTTSGADVPAVGNVRDTDTVGGVPGTLSSNKILKSNATGDGAGNYDDDNLAVGNVRPVAFGLGLTGDLSNLIATDAAYVALEEARNNDNGTVAADILTGESVKIRNSTTNGSFDEAARNSFDGTAADILTGKTVKIQNVPTAGTFDEAARNSFDGTAADILTGKTVKIQNVPTAGSFDEVARNTDPGVANVKDGTAYKIQNADLEGELVAGGGGIPTFGGRFSRRT